MLSLWSPADLPQSRFLPVVHRNLNDLLYVNDMNSIEKADTNLIYMVPEVGGKWTLTVKPAVGQPMNVLEGVRWQDCINSLISLAKAYEMYSSDTEEKLMRWVFFMVQEGK